MVLEHKEHYEPLRTQRKVFVFVVVLSVLCAPKLRSNLDPDSRSRKNGIGVHLKPLIILKDVFKKAF